VSREFENVPAHVRAGERPKPPRFGPGGVPAQRARWLALRSALLTTPSPSAPPLL